LDVNEYELAVEAFVTLFRGRGDVYGHNEGRAVRAPLDRDRFLKHLSGEEPIGVYPVVPFPDGTFRTVWGCSDFDTSDAWDHACRLTAAFEAAGVKAWIERSRSKGYHVWVFVDEPVPAADMRRMFLAAHAVADVPAKEVNPKQETLRVGQLGNYVRLPYPSWQVPELRQRIVYKAARGIDVMPFAQFVHKAMDSRVTATRVAELAALYVPPPVVHVPVETEYDATLEEAMELLSPLGKVIWRDGPLPNKDRSGTLAKLGHETVRSGLNPSQTRIILKTADLRWGKYHLRPDCDYEIDKLVVRVHS